MAVLGTLTDSKFPEAVPGDTPSGTKVLFQQTAAPTGWTKDVTHNEKTLRVVSGSTSSGGSQAFSTVFGAGKNSGSHTLSSPQMPSHGHPFQAAVGGPYNPGSDESRVNTFNSQTNNTGGGGSHSHSLSLDIQYVDVIVATKD